MVGLLARFIIHQFGCISNLKILGGSSFYISALIENYLTTCNVIDNFDNNYFASCYFPFLFTMTEEYNVQISVLLQYEHFDAFGGEEGLHIVLISK